MTDTAKAKLAPPAKDVGVNANPVAYGNMRAYTAANIDLLYDAGKLMPKDNGEGVVGGALVSVENMDVGAAKPAGHDLDKRLTFPWPRGFPLFNAYDVPRFQHCGSYEIIPSG
jgi:hypothetical protein